MTDTNSKERLARMRRYAHENGIPILREKTEKSLAVTPRLLRPTKILENGTAIGYSGAVMLLNSQAVLNTIEIDEEKAEIAKENFRKLGLSSRVNVFCADAREAIRQFTGEYDLIFLDGPKAQYAEFLPYLRTLLRGGGVLIADNVLFRDLVKNLPDKKDRFYGIALKLRGFLAALETDGWKTEVLEIDDGISVSVKTEDEE